MPDVRPPRTLRKARTLLGVLAAGLQIDTGSAGWTLTTVEEPGSILFLTQALVPAVDTVFLRAGQEASLAPSRTYHLEFLVQPLRGATQGFRLVETSGTRTFTFTLRAVRDALPPRGVLYCFHVSAPEALDVVKMESLTRFSLP